MKYQLWVWFWLCAGCNEVSSMDFSFHGRTSIPWSTIPTSDNFVSFGHNQLTSVTVPAGRNVKYFYLNNNLLTEFPDLENIKTTLTDLKLSNNYITDISPPSRLWKLQELRWLIINDNPLMALPEMAYLPPKVSTFRFQQTYLKTLPDMCRLDVSERVALDVSHKGNAYDCGGLLWTRLATNLGIVTTDTLDPSTAAVCNLHGNQQPLQQWNNHQLIWAGDLPKGEQKYQRMVDVGTFRCYPDITRVIPSVSKAFCGSACSRLEGCAMFASDNRQCVLTQYTGTFGTQTQFTAYRDWFVAKID